MSYSQNSKPSRLLFSFGDLYIFPGISTKVYYIILYNIFGLFKKSTLKLNCVEVLVHSIHSRST